MNIREAIEKSCDRHTICIVKEALFCKVYEESAWRFVTFVKQNQPGSKYVKKVDMDVVSIGFPKTGLAGILAIAAQRGFVLVREEETWLAIKTTDEPEGHFAAWKQAIVANTAMAAEKPLPPSKTTDEDHEKYRSLLREIEMYPVAESTPLQSMVFLAGMQGKIKGIRKIDGIASIAP